ncbi:MAG: TonB-dependent receptor [Desulfobacterales bacterium]
MKKWCLILTMAPGLFIFWGMGQAAEQTSEPPLMKETVVTATRFEEEVSAVPANVSVITAEDIENSTAKDIPSILRTQAGVFVTDISGNRRTYRVDLRGFGETAQSNTLVLVDGRRANQPDLSGTDWALIPLDRVERIEIIRGGRGGVLYGDNASGGVINIITKKGERFETGGTLAGGSYETTSANAYISGTQKDLSFALSGSYYDSDGYRDNSDSEAKDFGLNLGYFFGDFAKLSFSSSYHEDETGIPGALKDSELAAGLSRTDTTHPDDFSDVDDYYLKLLPEIYFLDDSLFQLDLSLRERDSSFFSSFTGGTFEGDTEIETVIISPQFIFKEPVLGFTNNLTFGFDYLKSEEDILNTTFFLGFPTTNEFSLEKENQGFYIHDEFYPLDKLALSAGYRHDEVEYRFDPSTPDKADFDENLITAGVNYNYHDESYLYVSFSESFRYPVLDEAFDFFTNTIDTTLIPQTSDDYEIGVRHHFTNSLWINLNLFRIDTEDEIFFNPTKGFFGANDNLDGKTRREGVELTVGKTFKNVTLNGTYTYTNSEIKSGQFSGNEVPNVPEHKATLDAAYSPLEGLTVALNGIYVGQRLFESDFANAFPEQDHHIVLNAKFKYKWQKYTAFLDINNILDEEYSEFGVLSSPPVEPAFYPSPEINFLVGVSAAF